MPEIRKYMNLVENLNTSTENKKTNISEAPAAAARSWADRKQEMAWDMANSPYKDRAGRHKTSIQEPAATHQSKPAPAIATKDKAKQSDDPTTVAGKERINRLVDAIKQSVLLLSRGNDQYFKHFFAAATELKTLVPDQKNLINMLIQGVHGDDAKNYVERLERQLKTIIK